MKRQLYHKKKQNKSSNTDSFQGTAAAFHHSEPPSTCRVLMSTFHKRSVSLFSGISLEPPDIE